MHKVAVLAIRIDVWQLFSQTVITEHKRFLFRLKVTPGDYHPAKSHPG